MADDNPMNLMVFRSLLKQTKIQIDTAGSGDECLALSDDRKYDLIFLDHMMPVKDGIETLHELRAREKSPNHNTPVICLTANAISGAREQYIDTGFDDYLTKPIDSSRLEEMIMFYLPKDKVKDVSLEAVNGNAAGQSVPEALQPLCGQKWIDISLGIKNSGTTEAYLSLLKAFYESLDAKADEIEKLYTSENWKDYTIQVHSLKSSARLIGAAGFGEEAQLLENAGKHGDTAAIRSRHRDFMKEFLSFSAPLAEIFSVEAPEEKKPEADREMMETLYEKIRTAAEEMDIEALESLLAGMSRYSIPESERAKWDQLTDATGRYDYDMITAILTKET